MSNTAAVEVAPGVTVTANMTPVERHNAIARSLGAATVERPVAPRQWHTNATVTTFANAERDSRAAPPSQTTLPKSAPSTGNSLADFEEDMRQKGLMRTDAPVPPTGPVEVDASAVKALNARWRELASGMKGNEATLSRFRALYERDLQSLYLGRKLGEPIADFYARIGQKVPVLPGHEESDADSLMKSAKAPAQKSATPVSQFTPAEWEAGHKSVTDEHGYIPVDRINPAGLSGYILPRFITGQTYRADIFDLLATARAANYTQAQVNAFIRAGMVKARLLT